VLSHLHGSFGIKLGWLAFNGGWLGVQIFFIISGYLIIKSAEKYNGLEYFIHRFFRIWPAYIFWFLIIGVATRKINAESITDPSLYPHLVLMQHFFPFSYLKYDILKTTWTLTVEVIWYAIAFFLAYIGKKSYIPLAIASTIIGTWWVYSGKTLHPLWGKTESTYDYFFIANLFIAQLPFFFFGCVIAMNRFKPSLFYCSLIAIGILSTYDSWINNLPNPIFISGIAVAAIFYVAISTESSFNNKIISFSSDISYSIYLIHYPIIILVQKKMHGGYFPAFVAFMLTICIAWLSYRFIEKPFVEIGRKLSNRFYKSATTSSTIERGGTT